MPQELYELFQPEQSFLSRADLRILTTDGNRQALALHRNEKADLIIAYLDSRQMSGEDLCSQIRNDEALRGVSILLICRGQESEIERCLNCNANAYLTMPVIPALLLQEAHQLLTIAPRISCRIPVKIRLECEMQGIRALGTIENISTSGLFFRTAADLPDGATVHCSFSVEGSRQVTVSGEVERIIAGKPQSGYGLSFFDISTEAASVIGRLSSNDKTASD